MRSDSNCGRSRSSSSVSNVSGGELVAELDASEAELPLREAGKGGAADALVVLE